MRSEPENAPVDALGGPAKRWTESLALRPSGSPGVIAVSCGMPATKAMDSARPGGGLVRRHRSNALYAAMRAAGVKQQLIHDCRESPETGHCLAVCPAELASMRSRAPGCARRFAGSAAPGVRPPAGPSFARPLQAEPVARHQLSLQTRGAGQPDTSPTPRPLRPDSANSVDTHQGRLQRRYAIYDP